jgi:hypothetical protein
VKRAAVWLVSVPLALAGTEVAHALANAAFGSPEGSGELFESQASGRALLPPFLATLAGAILLGLVLRIAAREPSQRNARSAALPFCLLPPLAFALLEPSEALLNRGHVAWGELLEATFVVGLALQLPFSLAGYSLARLLLRASDGVRALMLRDRPTAPIAATADVAVTPYDNPPSSSQRGSNRRDRAPPARGAVPG